MHNPKNAFKTFVENPKRNISANKPASHKLSASSQRTIQQKHSLLALYQVPKVYCHQNRSQMYSGFKTKVTNSQVLSLQALFGLCKVYFSLN